MRSDHVEASGEVADPVVGKARRSHERQGASGSGIGPTETPGMPEMAMRGKRVNGNLGREGTAAIPSSSPAVARRRRGAR